MDNMDFNPAVGQTMPWYAVWMQVITHPSRDSFRRILADPNAKPSRAFIWVAVIGVIFGIIQAVLIQVLGSSMFGNFGNVGGLGNLAVTMICVLVAVPILSILGLALGAAILRGIASLLKGVGNYNDMVYSLGAIQAPISIVSYLISIITSGITAATTGGANPFGAGSGAIVSLCLLPFSLALGVYAVVLEVLAVDTIEKFGTGKAVLTVLIPVIVVILLGACLAAVVAIATVSMFQR